MILPVALKISAAEPILPVTDVAAALAYYRETLGFAHPWSWGEPPTHGGASLGSCAVQFSQQEEISPATLYVKTEDVEVLYRLHAHAEIVSPLETHPWGMREYTVCDPNGHRIRFGQMVASGFHHLRAETPEGLEIRPEIPTVAEYEELIDAVGWRDYTPRCKTAELLSATLFGVTARLGGVTIGCALVMGDPIANLVVREVMVRPEHQSRGVGKAIMTELTRLIDVRARPATYVTLLCSPDRMPFYEGFGFRAPEEGLRGMWRWIPPESSDSAG